MVARSSAPCCSVSPLRVGVSVIDGVQLISWVGASLKWPTYLLVPPLAAPTSVERLGDLSGAKVKRYEGSVAKSLSIEIAHVVFVLLSDNARAFLQECQSAQGLPTTGHLRAWASPRVGHIGPKSVLFFSWKIEIVFYFNSELNFGN